MTEDHPAPHLLAGFMRDQVGGDERRRIVRHLLAGCGRCLRVTRRFWQLGESRPRGGPELAGADLHPASYRDVFKRRPSRGSTPCAYDPLREPPRIAVAFHHLAWRLAKAGSGEEALAALQQARALAEDLLPMLRAHGIRQGTALALLFFRDLVETGRLTPEVLFAVSRYLYTSVQAGRPAAEAGAALIDLPR